MSMVSPEPLPPVRGSSTQSSAGLRSLFWPGTHTVVGGVRPGTVVVGGEPPGGLAHGDVTAGYDTVATALTDGLTVTVIVRPSRRNASVGSGMNDTPSPARFQPGQSVALPLESTEAPGQTTEPEKLLTVCYLIRLPLRSLMSSVACVDVGVNPFGTMV